MWEQDLMITLKKESVPVDPGAAALEWPPSVNLPSVSQSSVVLPLQPSPSVSPAPVQSNPVWPPPSMVIPEFRLRPRVRAGVRPTKEWALWDAYRYRYPMFKYPEKHV